jgi:alkylation response protein AidB-like acyl-CoA dehydrogenase
MITNTPSPDRLLDELHEWLRDAWDPDLTLRVWWERLADSGWSQAHWPVEWFGKGTTRAESATIARAIRDFGAVPGPVGFANGMAGPTVLEHGTDEQKRRHLRGMVTGADAFCQLFSEPNAGSDLAGLQTRAELDGDEWVGNGQKVWTSGGQIANKAMLVARTDVDVPKHAGISYFFIDVRQPGVEIRPLREMTGRAYFNEVFLTDARIPRDDLIGGEGNGWAVANTTLAFERALSGGEGVGTSAEPGEIAGDLDRRAGSFVTRRAEASNAVARLSPSQRLGRLARQMGRSDDPSIRQGLARLHSLERLNGITTQRARALQNAGRDLPGLPNLAKMAANHAIRLARDLTFAILGPTGTLHGYDPEAGALVDALSGVDDLNDLTETALFAAAPPIYGGSDQIQRNIVGDRILGLAREPSVEQGIAFRDLPKN